MNNKQHRLLIQIDDDNRIRLVRNSVIAEEDVKYCMEVLGHNSTDSTRFKSQSSNSNQLSDLSSST